MYRYMYLYLYVYTCTDRRPRWPSHTKPKLNRKLKPKLNPQQVQEICLDVRHIYGYQYMYRYVNRR